MSWCDVMSYVQVQLLRLAMKHTRCVDVTLRLDHPSQLLQMRNIVCVFPTLCMAIGQKPMVSAIFEQCEAMVGSFTHWWPHSNFGLLC